MMKCYKTFSVLCCIFSVVIFLSACSSSDSGDVVEKADVITVYDVNDKKIAEFTSEEEIIYFSELVGNSTENMGEDNASILYRDLPEDAEISFKYVFTHTKDNGQKTTVDFFVYENYPYITLKGIPVITPLTWELSADDNTLLQNPTKQKNK